ncbi:hypothetical protein OQA88_9108 [Cercophora sp. LCS_1]
MSLPTTMRAWTYTTASGGLEKNLTLSTIALPTLPTNGPPSLLVRILSASLNPADHKLPELPIVSRIMIRTPATPGMDFSGVVASVSPSVTDFKPGDQVFGRLPPTQHGTCGEYIVTAANTCALLPAGVSPDDGAAMGTAGLTEYQVMKGSKLQPGDKVFINGGSGGTGTFGVQIAKAMGAWVLTTCSTGKVEMVKGLGADEVVDYTKEDVGEAVKSKGQVFKLAVDNVGDANGLYKAAGTYLVEGGRYVQVGARLDVGSVTSMVRSKLLPGFLGGGKRGYEFFMIRDAGKEDLEVLGKWLAAGKIKPVISDTFEFEEVPRAYAKLKEGKAPGKIVVHVGKVDG